MSYRFGFNSKMKDNEIYGEGNAYDFGARIYDPRIARWQACDPLAVKYPSLSPYQFAGNIPTCAVDGDGRLIIFIGGLRTDEADGDQPGHEDCPKCLQGIYNNDIFGYWSTDRNTFGREAHIDKQFSDAYKDDNLWYTSGSSEWRSQADDRKEYGKTRAEQFHAMVQDGQIKLADNEEIIIVAHSQGGAYSAGFAEELMSYKDENGNQLYNVKIIYYITPHQPADIDHPDGVEGVQFSHPGDAVSSSDWWLNGGSSFAKIPGVSNDDFHAKDIMGGEGQPPCGTAAGNRCGHNVTDNDQFIGPKLPTTDEK